MTTVQQNNQQTILIVDDTPTNLGMAVGLFEERGYRVAIAQEGEEGIQRAQLVRPDLILLDVMMPGIDGYEVCRRLKALPATAGIPVIFMTALSDTAHKIAGFRAGGVDYVTKPLQVDEVAARVDTHLKLSAAQRLLETQNAELTLYRDHLARLVVERTAELSAANEALNLRSFALNQVNEAAYLIDENARFLYVNDESCRALGYSREELLGMTVMDIGPGWTTERWAQSWQSIRAIGTLNLEAMHRRKDGSVFPVDIHASNFEYDGRAYNLALVRDITERKRVERELVLLNTALDQSFDATYLVDTDLRFRYVNAAAVRSLGYSREELLSMGLLDIDPNVTREMVHDLMQQTAAAGRFPGIVESAHRRKDGSLFPVEVGATTFTHDGETLFLTVVRDISARKRVEEKLKASEREFRTLAENIPDHIIRYDAQGRKTYLNTATARLMGIAAADVLGQTPEETPPELHATPLGDFSAALRRTLDTGMPQEIEVPIRHAAQGAQIHNVRFVAERDTENRIVGALMVGRDITDIKNAERQLEESRDLLRDLAARRETAREEERRHIAREIHDELGQQLSALRLKVGILNFQFGQAEPGLREAVGALLAMVDNTIRVARNVSTALRPAVVDMGVEPALGWLAAEFSRHAGIPCEVGSIAPDIRPNEEQATVLFRIAQESLTNVARHAKAHRVRIALTQNGDSYELAIADDGLGFDIGSPRKLKSFGLVGMRERALSVGGTVAIESHPGAGTIIRVRIPATAKGGTP